MGLAVISTALRASVLHFGPACTPGPFGLGVGGAFVTEGGCFAQTGRWRKPGSSVRDAVLPGLSVRACAPAGCRRLG